MSDVTRILSQIEHGDSKAAAQLLPLAHDELRKLAAAKLAQQRPGQTLQATALVHEAYVRPASEGDTEGGDFEGGNWNSRLSVVWAYVASFHRTWLVLLCALFLAVATTGAWGADGQQERPWRVLLVHSFGSSAPPFTTHSTAFESTLKRELGTKGSGTFPKGQFRRHLAAPKICSCF